MTSKFERAVNDLAQVLQETNKPTISGFDTQANVLRVDGNIAWVHIPGGIEETPVQLTTNAKKGDVVQVRVAGGRAWTVGNITSPPTDDTKAIQADTRAVEAMFTAIDALSSSEVARQAADMATEYANEAQTSAAQAGESAQQAQNSAGSAYSSASQAINQLSVVEDIVGVLSLISKNGTYTRVTDVTPIANKWYFRRTETEPYEYFLQQNLSFEFIHTVDETITPGKPYFTRSGTGTEYDPYMYTQVDDPIVSELSTYFENTGWNYFELSGIDQSIQNYVSSHLTLSGNSLYLQNGNTRLQLSTTDGLVLYNSSGNPVARYGIDTVIGDINQFGIKVGRSPEYTELNPVYELGFYQDGNRVAYINNNSLYITQTVVLKQMQMGDNLGVWAWCIHTINNSNNLYLKWLG